MVMSEFRPEIEGSFEHVHWKICNIKLFMAELLKFPHLLEEIWVEEHDVDSAMGQIPCSTERISSILMRPVSKA